MAQNILCVVTYGDDKYGSPDKATREAFDRFLQSPLIRDWKRFFADSYLIEIEYEKMDDIHALLKKHLGEGSRHFIQAYSQVRTGWHDTTIWEWVRKKNTPSTDVVKTSSGTPGTHSNSNETPKLTLLTNAKDIGDYCGIDAVRQSLNAVMTGIAFRRDAAKAGLKLEDGFNNMMFAGPPGAGKTSLACTAALELQKKLQVNGKVPVYLIEAKDIIARYTGQTVNNLKSVLNDAAGGILVFDEIDAFLNIASYGKEVIDTLNTHMGNARNSPIIIGTLYGSREADFWAANQGLSSRFRHRIRLSGYDDRALAAMFGKIADAAGLTLDKGVLPAVEQLLKETRLAKKTNFGNGREVDNIFNTVIDTMAVRYQAAGECELETDEHRDAFRKSFGTVTVQDVPERDPLTGGYKLRETSAAAQARPANDCTVLRFTGPVQP